MKKQTCENAPQLSVVVPVFNESATIVKAIERLHSMLGDYRIEILIVDDGSTDNTSEIVERYTSCCPNIHLFRRSANRGVAAARNIGVKLSAGRFITFLDSDDEYAVNHLALRRQILQDDSKLRMLHGGFRVIGHPLVPDKDDPQKMIHLDQCEVGGTFVVKRDVFAEIGGFEDLKYGEDSHFYEMAVESNVTCKLVDYPSYIYYRDINGQITSKEIDRRIADFNAKQRCV